MLSYHKFIIKIALFLLAFSIYAEEFHFLFSPNASTEFANEEASQTELNRLVKTLLENDTRVVVKGYTAFAFNDIDPEELAQQRIDYLYSKLNEQGIDWDMASQEVNIIVSGVSNYWGNNSDEEERYGNRRVVVEVEKVARLLPAQQSIPKTSWFKNFLNALCNFFNTWGKALLMVVLWLVIIVIIVIMLFVILLRLLLALPVGRILELARDSSFLQQVIGKILNLGFFLADVLEKIAPRLTRHLRCLLRQRFDARNCPKEGVKWDGELGNSRCYPNKEMVGEKYKTKGEVLDEFGIKFIPYVCGEPDFSAVSKGEVKIKNFTADRDKNFPQADKEHLPTKWVKQKKR